MGVNDAQEMLDAAKEQAILDEREIARLRAKLDAIRALPADVAANGTAWIDAADVAEILDEEETP